VIFLLETQYTCIDTIYKEDFTPGRDCPIEKW